MNEQEALERLEAILTEIVDKLERLAPTVQRLTDERDALIAGCEEALTLILDAAGDYTAICDCPTCKAADVLRAAIKLAKEGHSCTS